MAGEFGALTTALKRAPPPPVLFSRDMNNELFPIKTDGQRLRHLCEINVNANKPAILLIDIQHD